MNDEEVIDAKLGEQIKDLRHDVEVLHEHILTNGVQPTASFFWPWYLVFALLLIVQAAGVVFIAYESITIRQHVSYIGSYISEWEIEYATEE